MGSQLHLGLFGMELFHGGRAFVGQESKYCHMRESPTDMILPNISLAGRSRPHGCRKTWTFSSRRPGHEERSVITPAAQAEIPLEFAPDEEIEFLVGPADLDVGLDRDGIVALQKGIKGFRQGDGPLLLQALGEVVPLENPLERVAETEIQQARQSEGFQPLAVETDFRLERSRILKTWSV